MKRVSSFRFFLRSRRLGIGAKRGSLWGSERRLHGRRDPGKPAASDRLSHHDGFLRDVALRRRAPY
ncbi:hypothetical protein C5689_00485 [Methylosinus sporium]|uniref:Uncharacterized protein n=1 Tax=Methylosinus sporium TaxID=428 RepID=A0A2U1SVL5_METSR|nr:hypothetical protein C5689_00485 [Methylosinus sporium]